MRHTPAINAAGGDEFALDWQHRHEAASSAIGSKWLESIANDRGRG